MKFIIVFSSKKWIKKVIC